jgi:bifunctional non-homologous end joining protein LigD
MRATTPNRRRTPRSLTTYRRKRDFTTSPEPSGRNARSTRGRLFCIQKHLASHLHYDFRLEHRGVLLSWAVPKGPSPDPGVKRLAMQVEDHPLAYGAFEGVIPSGYGAGIVVLWDTGAWEPLVDDVDQALAQGKLPFVVLGEKLTGAWTLLRAARAGRNAWLLMKQRDAWAARDDLTRRAPASVASGGDFADVLAQAKEDPWQGRPPVAGGETGALFRQVMAEAARLRERSGRSRRGRSRTDDPPERHS